MVTKTADQVRGITSTKPVVVVNPKPYNPARKHMSYEDAIKDNERMRRANEAAEAARRQVLEAQLSEEPKGAEVKDVKYEEKVLEVNKKIAELRSELSVLNAQILEDPDDPKVKGLKIKRGKLNKALDVAENELDDLESR